MEVLTDTELKDLAPEKILFLKILYTFKEDIDSLCRLSDLHGAAYDRRIRDLNSHSSRPIMKLAGLVELLYNEHTETYCEFLGINTNSFRKLIMDRIKKELHCYPEFYVFAGETLVRKIVYLVPETPPEQQLRALK